MVDEMMSVDTMLQHVEPNVALLGRAELGSWYQKALLQRQWQ